MKITRSKLREANYYVLREWNELITMWIYMKSYLSIKI